MRSSALRWLPAFATLTLIAPACSKPHEQTEVVRSGIDFNTGNVKGTLSWGGVALNAGEAQDLLLFEAGSVSEVFETADYQLLDVAVGPHTVALFSNACTGASGAKIGQQSFVVTANTTINADYDLTATAGRLVSSAHINGAPLAHARVQIAGANLCTQDTTTDGNGTFSRVLPPGEFTASIFTSGGVLRAVTFSIAIGQTTNVADLDVQVGDVQGTLSWGGVALNAGEAQDLFMFEPGSVSEVFETADYQLRDVGVGPHTVALYSNTCTGASGAKIGQQSFVVTAGTTVDADYDLTATAGRLVGSAHVNGAPLAQARVQIAGTNLCTQDTMTDGNGTFSRILPPGEFTASIFTSGGILGSVSFAIVAGKTANVDSVTTPKCSDTTTPKCSEIPTELNGGLSHVNGLSLTFTEVDPGGNTTVFETESCFFGCDPVPSSFEVVGNRFWDINTTAGHTGPITVCIHYDSTSLMGNEDDLSLRHDDGGDWMVITTSLCKSNGCTAKSDPCEPCEQKATICGVATSLSPFAIMEPLSAPDTTPPAFAGVPGTVTAYATSTAGAVVSYAAPTAVDDVDGPTAVSCTPASGSEFPPGQTTVNCTTSDVSGNPNAVSFVVWVQYQAPGDGSFFLKPIRADGSSTFRIGRPVPVKFRLTGASQQITNLKARLVVSKISDEVRGTADDESDEDGDETDFLFKYRKAKGIYAYRWKTFDQTRGTYRLRADLGDGVVHEINVSLKARR